MNDPLLHIHRSDNVRAVLRPIIGVMIVGLAAIIVPASVTVTRVELVAPVVLIGAIAAAGLLMRRGKPAAASLVLIALLLVTGTIAVVTYGSIRSVTSVTFIGAVVVAGIFLNRRGLIATIVVASALVGAIIYAETVGVIVSLNRPVGFVHWVVLAAALLIIGFAVHYSRVVALEAIARQSLELEERNQADASVRAMEERLRLSIEASRQGWFDVNLGTGVVESSSRLVDILGADPDGPRMSLDRWIESIHAEDRASILATLRDCLDSGESRQADYRMITFDGQVRWIRSIAKVVEYDAKGKPVRLTGTHRDVTDQMRASEQLRANEEQLRVVMDTMPGLVAQVGPDGRYRRLNKGYEALAGVPTHALVGKHVREVVGEAEWQSFRKYWELALTGMPQEYETCVQLPGQAPRWLRRWVTPHLDAAGNVLSVVVLAEDVTAIKQTALEAQRKTDEFQSMIAATTDGLIVVAADGSIVEANDAFCRLAGCPHDVLIGTAIHAFNGAAPAGDDAPHTFSAAVAATAGVALALLRRADGALLDVEVSRTHVPSTDRTFCFVRDVTERRKVEEQRLRSQKLESLGTLAGGIAHDFNNILSAIRGNAELALSDVGPHHDAAESLTEIDRAAARAAELVRRITAFGRPKEPTRRVTDLAPVVREVMQLLRPTVPAGIALRVTVDDELPSVVADAAQVHEALVNLTTNAVHAIGANVGAIEYAVRRVQLGAERAATLGLLEGAHVQLSVTDTGCGMDEATQARIFDAYFTTKAIGEGTGLGLSMVYGIMQSHRGAVSVESTVGVGSTFHLHFPAAAEAAETLHEAASTVSQPHATRRVLFVDDEPALVKLAHRALTLRGHQVDGFTHPGEALAHFRQHATAFDVVVTDLSMPHMSGLDFARQIRAENARVPVVMFTGRLRAEDEAAARDVGIQRVVGKAQSVAELTRAVEQAT